jgi:hypothetical protein
MRALGNLTPCERGVDHVGPGGRWAIVPTWLFFVVLGNSSSGGAVSPPLLLPPFAFVLQWLPSGATVTSCATRSTSPVMSMRGRSWS